MENNNIKLKKENRKLGKKMDTMFTEEEFCKFENIITKLKEKLKQYGEDVENYDY